MAKASSGYTTSMAEVVGEFVHRYEVLLRIAMSCSQLTFDVSSKGVVLNKE